MKQSVAKKAIEQTALRFGVSYDEVNREIGAAIAEAMKSQNQSLRMLLGVIPRQNEEPTPEELIMYISDFVGQQKRAAD